jgi:hypothetical protein
VIVASLLNAPRYAGIGASSVRLRSFA